MKIIHLIDNSTTVGAITSINKIITNSKDKNISHIYGYYNNSNFHGERNSEDKIYLDLKFNKTLNEFLKNKFKIWLIPLVIYSLIIDTLKLNKLMQCQKIDVIHAHYVADYILAILISRNFKKVIHIRSILNFDGPRYIIKGVFKAVLYKRIDLILGISKTVLKNLNLKGDKIKVLYNGLESNLLTKESFEQKYDLINVLPMEVANKRLIGCVSRYNKNKGIDFFIKIAKQLKGHEDSLHFVVVAPVNSTTEWEYKKHIEKLIKDFNLEQFVTLIDGLPHPSYFMKHFWLLVHPTQFREGFGNVVLEAQRFGVPVVSTNCGGPAEIIEDSKSGYICKSLEPECFKNKILELLKNKELHIKFSNQATKVGTQEKFDLKRNLKVLNDSYKIL